MEYIWWKEILNLAADTLSLRYVRDIQMTIARKQNLKFRERSGKQMKILG